MAKYRILTTEELASFEKEFIEYLVVNGITADEWGKMKTEENEKAQKIVDLFSDVIMESVLRKINFLEIRGKGYVQGIQCLADKMVMVAVSTKNPEVDLTNVDWGKVGVTADLELHKGEKNYTDNREAELFDMVQKGYFVSDGLLFKQLQLASVQ